MLRLLATPKWLGVTVLLLAVALGCLWLGSWQWTRAHPLVAPSSSATGPAVALSAVYAPGEGVPASAVGKPVAMTGRYDGSAQLLVPRESADGRSVFWVLTPLRFADGSVIPVVRGSTTEPGGSQLAPPEGRVSVTGTLAAPESDSLRAMAPDVLPDGQVAIVSSAELLSLWQGDLYQGFAFLDHQRPASALSPVPPPLATPDRGLSLRSFAYAIQWWLFAAFAVFFWWRMLQAEWADRQDDHTDPSSPDLSEARS